MASKSDIKIINEPNDDPVADIIFIHGISGDKEETWKHKNGAFWPDWLASEFPKARILTISHPSEKYTKMFEGGGMGLKDRSLSTLEILLNYEVGKVPFIFITHSLGGLIAKSLLRKSCDKAQKDYQNFMENCAGIIFLATPHIGSSMANIVDAFGVSSSICKDLKSGEDPIKDLREWYASHTLKSNVKTLAFSEAFHTSGLLVVPSDSAHPGVSDCEPVPVDANHIDICKFDNEKDSTYMHIKRFLKKIFSDLDIDASPELLFEDLDYYVTSKPNDRKTLAEKLTEGDRAEEVSDAERAKEEIAKIIHRNGLSQSERRKNKEFLGAVVSKFKLLISPRIVSGESKIDVNERIQEKIIDPVCEQKKHSLATQEGVHGSIYYLTGNCHIDWKKNDN